MTKEQIRELRDEILRYGFDYDEYWSESQRHQVWSWQEEYNQRIKVYKD